MITVDLPDALTEGHIAAVTVYLRGRQPLSSNQWRILLEAMDILRDASITVEDETHTFAGVYNRFVDSVHADVFINQLYTFTDVTAQGARAGAIVARQIIPSLRQASLYDPVITGTHLLAAFCLYWWGTFVRGYAFEMAVYRDLADSSIAFEACDLRVREDRLSPYDLTVPGFRGDIKASTYFLHVRRVVRLISDLFVTRLYDPSGRQ